MERKVCSGLAPSEKMSRPYGASCLKERFKTPPCVKVNQALLLASKMLNFKEERPFDSILVYLLLSHKAF